ncbi:sugar transferase, partial [Limosilactobacillus fermentum]
FLKFLVITVLRHYLILQFTSLIILNQSLYLTCTLFILGPVIKLRSMRNDAEAKTGAVWAQKNDPRVTAVGRFMRKTRIDELPQFWNVLKGDMSMIGPRPERPELTEKFYKQWPEFPQRLRIIPGITGYAQVNGGYDISPEEKCHLDNYYIENYSFTFDVKIALETIKTMFTGDGAR